MVEWVADFAQPDDLLVLTRAQWAGHLFDLFAVVDTIEAGLAEPTRFASVSPQDRGDIKVACVFQLLDLDVAQIALGKQTPNSLYTAGCQLRVIRSCRRHLHMLLRCRDAARRERAAHRTLATTCDACAMCFGERVWKVFALDRYERRRVFAGVDFRVLTAPSAGTVALWTGIGARGGGLRLRTREPEAQRRQRSCYAGEPPPTAARTHRPQRPLP